jgi:hypothetical protein
VSWGSERLYLLREKEEIDRRKGLLGPGVAIETWQDLYTPGIVWIGDDETRRLAYAAAREAASAGLYWVGEEAKRMLESAGGELPFELAVDGQAVSIYYGPRLADTESLPSEESLKARVLSAHGIAVVWATYDQLGRRSEHQPSGPTDPLFYLRRTRGRVAHLWRLFRTKAEAIAFAAERGARDPEMLEWAEQIPVADFEELLRRFGQEA